MAFASARHVISKVPRALSHDGFFALRSIGTSARLDAKRIVEEQEGDVTVIQGKFVESPHAGNVISSAEPGCPLCRLGIHNVTHDDVLILSQFMDKDGNMLPPKITGLCGMQHRKVATALYKAQRIGLIRSEKHAPRERWQELNNYFGTTRTKTDFGKPKIDIRSFLKRPRTKLFWRENETE